MRNHKRYRSYEERFIVLSNVIEGVIRKLVFIFLVSLLISQLLLTIDPIRKKIVPVDFIENSFYLKSKSFY